MTAESANAGISLRSVSGRIQINTTNPRRVPMKNILYCSLMLLCITACTKSAPKCSNSEVVEIITKLSIDEIYKNALSRKDIGMADYLRNGSYRDKTILNEWMTKGKAPALDSLKESKSSDVVKAAKAIESILDIKIGAIKTSSVDDNMQKCNCEAEIVFFDGNKTPIKYTAQRAEDGTIKVELTN
jgi:hypothetical protein